MDATTTEINYDDTEEVDIEHYISVIRSYRIIKEFINSGSADPELKNKFNEWLFFPFSREKNIALEITFHEMLSPVDADKIVDHIFSDRNKNRRNEYKQQ